MLIYFNNIVYFSDVETLCTGSNLCVSSHPPVTPYQKNVLQHESRLMSKWKILNTNTDRQRNIKTPSNRRCIRSNWWQANSKNQIFNVDGHRMTNWESCKHVAGGKQTTYHDPAWKFRTSFSMEMWFFVISNQNLMIYFISYSVIFNLKQSDETGMPCLSSSP